MLKAVKESVHKLTSHLQLISGYLEMEDYTKALGKTDSAGADYFASPLWGDVQGDAPWGATADEYGQTGLKWLE